MQKRAEGVRDVDICHEKILAILKEYNCRIEVDDDLGDSVVVVDKDNYDYVIIN